MPNMKPFATLVTAVLLTSCSTLQSRPGSQLPPPKLQASTAAAAAQKIKTAELPAADAVAIVLASEEDTPDEYVVRYGYARSDLPLIRRVKKSELMHAVSESGKTAVQIIIPNLAPGKTVFLAVSAVRGGKESAPTEVLEVK